MNRLLRRHRLFIVLLTAILAVPNVLRGAEPALPVVDPAKLSAVLGSDAGNWKITPAPVFGSESGRVAMSGATAQALTLESTTPHAAPTELIADFHLTQPAAGYAYIQVQMACDTLPDKTLQAINFSVNAPAGQPYVGYSASLQGPKTPPPPQSGTLYLQAISDRSLAWPEEIRAAVDAEIAAAPKVSETIFTLRCTVEKDRFRYWLNGRFVGEEAVPPETNPSGVVRVTLPSGAQLVSLQVRPLATVDHRFEPLSIGGNLNSDKLAGQKVDLATLPSKAIDGVPFEFPRPNGSGDDHIDVSTSWTRFGALPGYFMANALTFGGRWISADHVDPERICMYVPQGRYKALHLIAVADDRPDSVPIVTAQFYRPDAGHPVNFAGSVPSLKGGGLFSFLDDKPSVSVRLANGKKVKLYHVTIPLDPDGFSWLSDLPRIGLEITKQVQFYRGYPDPSEYSYHGAGLPSSVQIYGMTLERVGVDIDIQPDQFGHVWTAPATPGYTLVLRNTTGSATTAKLTITTRSHDGLDATRQEQRVNLPAGDEPVKVSVQLHPTRYGLQELTITLAAGNEKSTYHRNFAYLHPNTREQTTWEYGHGPLFGGWFWGGAHTTPPLEKELPVMAAAGAESSITNYSQSPPEVQAIAEKNHFISDAAFAAYSMYINGFTGIAGGPTFDPAKVNEGVQKILELLRKAENKPTPISRPEFLPFFAEPEIGPITMGTWPSHWGEDYTLSKDEQATFNNMKAKFLASASACRKEWPNVKLLLPYGDPMITVIFLKLCPEARGLIDGVALDMPCFERIPEQQVHQVVLNRLYPIMKDIHEYKPDPYLVLIEGFCVGSQDIDTGDQGQAEIGMRDFLGFLGYGVTRLESNNAGYDCANYWGENHYGGGWCARLPLAMPKLGYTEYATITRHLNRANFVKYVTTGSLSTYCQEYKHYKTGKLIHVLWTIDGKRPVSVKVDPGATLELYDPQDNVTVLKEKGGVATFTVDQSPVYLEGLTAEAQITLGEPDHSDAKPSDDNKKLTDFGDGSWKLVEKEDAEYAHNKPLQIERFLGKMTAHAVESAEAPHGNAGPFLAIHLEHQDKDRGDMPFYTTLEPESPITIPGKASYLGVWVHASSDWGRIVYVLRDAKGEKWVSVGTKEEWNNDDVHCWSSFCFDGWRYLRFEMPSSAPYDCFREHGTTWWGSYGGDGVVDLPLKLEKVIIERRPKAVYGNDLVETKPDDVLLSNLYAEYSAESDRGEEAVRLSKLRMPLPTNAPALTNPISDLAKTGVGPATTVLKVTDPLSEYDGTRCNVHFEPVANARGYDVWVSPYPDGRGAMKLGADWKESGGLIEGLRPETEFYLFVVYTDKDGKLSKPSAPLKFSLTDRFGYK